MTVGKTDSPVSSEAVNPLIQCDARRNEFELVIDRNHQIVFRYAYRLTGNRSAAEDISQEVFLKAFRNIHQLRESEKERAWLLAITRNEFARWLRGKSGRLSIDDVSPGMEPQTSEIRSELLLENHDWVQAALQQLSDEFRVVVLMYYFEELSYAEIAERLSIPIGTVMSRLSRGRMNLRRYLDEMAVPS